MFLSSSHKVALRFQSLPFTLGPWRSCANLTLSDSGLLVKQALIEARKQVHDSSSHDTYNNTYAIIFFGTPHRGSNIAYWGRLLCGIAQATQINTHDGILIDLDPKTNSSKLRELNLDFDDILCDSRKARQLRIFSFQEAQGMMGVNLLGGKVSLSSTV